MSAPWNGLSVKAARPRAVGVGLKGKDRELYAALHLAWAGGVVSGEWGLFAPAPGMEPEWWVDGQVFPRGARDAVRAHLAHLMFMAGVVGLEWGPQWMGRRDVVISLVEEIAA